MLRPQFYYLTLLNKFEGCYNRPGGYKGSKNGRPLPVRVTDSIAAPTAAASSSAAAGD
jgi:hypothetical protein